MKLKKSFKDNYKRYLFYNSTSKLIDTKCLLEGYNIWDKKKSYLKKKEISAIKGKLKELLWMWKIKGVIKRFKSVDKGKMENIIMAKK